MKKVSRRRGKLKGNLKELEREAAVICQEFAVFCTYVTENHVKLSKKTGNIGKKDCFALNGLFHAREEYEKPVYIQNKYPVICFFYYAAVRYKILEFNPSGSELQQGRNYQCFWEASVWEQYILLLTLFLFDGAFARKESYWYPDNIAELWGLYIDRFMKWADVNKIQVGMKYQWSRESLFLYDESLDFLARCLEVFGLIKNCRMPVQDDVQENSWEIEVCPLLETVNDLYENTETEELDDLEELPGSKKDIEIQCAYMAYMDRIMQGKTAGNLSRIFGEEDVQYKNQRIDLQVSMRYIDCIRVIRMNLKDTLYDLHMAIQRAVSFDNDHLFSFTVGRGMMKKLYTLPEAINRDTECTVDICLGELELRKGQTFTYLFDYGDHWQFDIKVMEIREGTVERPEVIKAVGDAPEQYPYCE